ncbi:MAG: hypothetical protein GC178_10965 [Flavobacteriales bacterium]|nr:hypothetical protein [Flavobacteriales bacterium]
MKNIGLTLVMLLFVGVTATMAQDKKEAAEAAKTEVKAESAEKHSCPPGCTMACCAGKSEADKKNCSHADQAKCAAHKEMEGKKEEHGNESSPK